MLLLRVPGVVLRGGGRAVSVFDEAALRALIAEEVGRALREAGSPLTDEYLTVVHAARVASVAPATIRTWIGDRRLQGFRAGRELRVSRRDLDQFMRSAPRREVSPEAAADAAFERARQRRSRKGSKR